MKLLSVANTKILKGQKLGYMTFGIHMAPSDLSGYQVCPKASKGCREACLNTAGRGQMNSVQQARIAKTRLFFENRPLFMETLIKEIQSSIKSAERKGYIPVFRLNLTSDIPFEKIRVPGFRNIFQMFPNVQFYDYTAIPRVVNETNYHLTFSLKEDNLQEAISAMLQGMNVAVVFAPELPKTWGSMMREVIDGDDHDLRFLDPKKVVVGLKAKGRAKKDTSGFVRFYKKES